MFIKLNRFKTLVNKALAAFSPASLFASGEQGVWYDPSDITTMFQDSAGTTPVTAVEQPVGLLLDKSKGLVLGSELVTNGTFDVNTSSWTLAAGGTATVSSGILTLTNVSSRARLSQNITTVAGRSYKVVITSVNLGNSTASSARVLLGSSQILLVAGLNNITYVATGVSTEVALFQNDTVAGLFFTLDNISVKELAGNHATQSTGTKRPVLSARYNLLIRTEEFNNASWTKDGINAFGSGSVANTTATTDPLGGNTADFIQESIGTGQHRVFQSVVTGIKGVRSFYVKSNGNSRFFFIEDLGASAWFNIDNGTLGTVGAGGTATITAVGTNGWYRCTLEGGSTGSQYSICGLSNADNVKSYIGDGTSGIFIWGAQLVPNNQSTIPYQRVVTGTRGTSTTLGTSDYDADPTKFPPYLSFDGIDDSMVTNSINFTATDKMTVWVGLRKIADASLGMVYEFGTNGNAAGSFDYFVATSQNQFGTNGTANAQVTYNAGAAPLTNVISAKLDNALAATPLSAITLRFNAADVTEVIASAGAVGNYNNYPLYIGARVGTSLYFNGNLYSLIIRGAASTATQITDTETYVNSKTKAY